MELERGKYKRILTVSTGSAVHSGKGRGLGHIFNYAVKSVPKSGLVAVFG